MGLISDDSGPLGPYWDYKIASGTVRRVHQGEKGVLLVDICLSLKSLNSPSGDRHSTMYCSKLLAFSRDNQDEIQTPKQMYIRMSTWYYCCSGAKVFKMRADVCIQNSPRPAVLFSCLRTRTMTSPLKDIPAQWAKIRQGLDIFRICSKCVCLSNDKV